MRTFIGYIIIIISIPILVWLLQDFTKEWEKFSPFTTYIDEKISIKEVSLPKTSTIKAGDGSVISQITNNENRLFLDYENIPQLLKDAFVTVEDRYFFQHRGIDFVAIGRAIVVNANNDGIEQGGSTITQQLARNLYLNQEKSYNRKLTELFYSFQLEKNYSKEEILELYMNAIYFGNGAYGIEAASRSYFNKPTNQLSDGELLFLAAIPNNPSLYNPIQNFNNTKMRQHRILDQLISEAILTETQATTIKKQPITLRLGKKIDLYPDYVTYVEKELRQLVAQKEGLTIKLKSNSPAVREDAEKELDAKVTTLLESGVTIHTALDKRLQSKAQQSLQENITDNQVEGSTVVIQHNTHELVSLTGAKDYKKYSFHRGYQSFRQPGSAIKPLLVYGPYIDMTGADINQKIDSSSFCKRSYCPGNYGDASYGFVSMKKAFSKSYNTPAVRLMNNNGIETSFSYLEMFDFKKVVKNDYLLPAAIGGFTYGMSPLELTAAYTSFHDGTYQYPRSIRKITDETGAILYQWDDKPLRIWKNSTVSKMRELLSSVVYEGTARKALYPTSGYIGGKTGTTNDVKDLWMIGLNDNYTTGVWIGKDKPQNIDHLSSAHLGIWKYIMQNTE